MKKFIVALLLGLLGTPSAFAGVLQGTVNSITAGRIMVDIWGGDKEEDFKLTNLTLLNNISSLNDLNAGDKVRILYDGWGDHKTASAITREIQTEDVVEF